MNKDEIISLIKEDQWMMEILTSAKALNLPDWWICAGFVRSKIWDVLHDFSERTTIPDIDVIYFDPANIDVIQEKQLEAKLNSLMPNIPWSVKNQARMHLISKMPPYLSSTDALSKFTETASALGVKLDEDDHVILTAPYGMRDVINLEVKPTQYITETKERMEVYENRIANKNWPSIWTKVKVYHSKDVLT